MRSVQDKGAGFREKETGRQAKVIVNPFAGTGLTGRKWPRIREVLREVGLSFDFVYTEGRGHAIELAREAAREGYQMVIAAGGDGTLNEVVNGLVDSGCADATALGILNTGTGCDFARFLAVPRNFREACERLVSPIMVRADVGVVECYSEGRPVRRCFISASGFGFDGEVVENAEKHHRIFHGVTPYLFGILHSFSTYRNKDVRLTMDDHAEETRICSVVVANGGFYAAGMRIAPQASLQDGLFEVMIVGDMGKFELLQMFPRAYRGTHVTHPKVRLEKAAQVSVDSDDRILIQADGELVGEGPAHFRILPGALNLLV